MTQRIYTRTGDEGDTGLFGGGRVSKADPRVEAYGEVDELNATLGWALTVAGDASIRSLLETVQADLFTIGAHLATPPVEDGRRQPWLPAIPTERVGVLERWIDGAEEELEPLRSFILPGGSPVGAALHLGRTVCRRTERRVIALAAQTRVEPAILVYLNRLSDVLFVAARLANARAGIPETRWEPRTGDER